MDELFYGERLKAKNRGGEIFLATVATVSSGGVTLLFDGQETASTKKYKILLNGAPLEAGDRVAVVKHAGTYLVLGAIGLADPYADAYVKKTGDTMTGALTISSGGLKVSGGGAEVSSGGLKVSGGGAEVLSGGLAVNLHTDVDAIAHTIDTPPSENMRDGEVNFRDKLKTVFARLSSFFGSDGNIGTRLEAFREIGGTMYYNILGLYVNASGGKSVYLSDPAAWRSELGLGSSGELPLLISQGGSGQTGITYTTNVSSIATAASGFSITAATFSKWGKIASLHMKITATSAVTSNTWTTIATLASGRRPFATTLAHELNNKSAVIYSNGSIQVWGQLAANALVEIYAAYLFS